MAPPCPALRPSAATLSLSPTADRDPLSFLTAAIAFILSVAACFRQITFEKWCEELEAEEKKKKEQEEKEKNEAEEKEQAARRAAKRQARQATAREDAAAEVDEEDEKIIEEAKKMNMVRCSLLLCFSLLYSPLL